MEKIINIPLREYEELASTVIIIAYIAIVLALPIMLLWNYVIVDFGLPELTFWKALCLRVLCSFLFKNNSSKKD